jgi:hypothetical protein
MAQAVEHLLLQAHSPEFKPQFHQKEHERERTHRMGNSSDIRLIVTIYKKLKN